MSTESTGEVSAAPAEAVSESVTEAVTESTEETTEVKAEEVVKEPRKQKFKFKIDGEESEEEIDLDDKEGLTKRLQLAKAAEKRIAAANSDRKKAFEILKAFEDGSLLKKHPKARELAETLLLEQIQDEMMDPKDKELREYKSKLEKYEQKEASDKKTLEAQAAKAQEDKLIAEFQTTIVTALEKSGLPKTPALAKRMAAIMDKNLDLGLKLSPDDLVQEVKQETLAMLKSIVGDADGEQLQAMFGEDIAKKIRMADVKKLKSIQNNVSQKGQKFEPTEKEPSRPKTIEEWKAEVARRVAE